MISLPRPIERHSRLLYPLFLLLLAALLVLSPAEATLGSVVKIVYLHGAMERVSVLAYLVAGLLGAAYLLFRRSPLVAWVRAVSELALAFWFGQFAISLPAQVLAWGGIAWGEPRVVSAAWVLLTTAVILAVARWMDGPVWAALGACANALAVLIILRGAVNALHPFNPILGSDSAEIKLYYFGIVLCVGALGLLLARARAHAPRS